MPIPDYQSLMLPLLKVLNQKELTLNAAVEILSVEFELTDEEKKRMLPSGQMTYLRNRTGWAATYLKMAGLVFYPRRGYVEITDEGKKVLKKNLSAIDNNFLKQYDSFNEFYRRKNSKDKSSEPGEIQKEITPEEALDYGYSKINETLADDLLDMIKRNSYKFFENLVVELLVKMGYGGSLREAGEVVGKSGDEGIDGIIKEDKLGLDKIYIQAKRWKDAVGRPEIQKFVGALLGQGATKGIFITNSRFTQEAMDYVENNKQINVVLIDGVTLADLMIEYNLGVSVVRTYEIKKIDTDYFAEDLL